MIRLARWIQAEERKHAHAFLEVVVENMNNMYIAC